ncbi:hypothetical protein Dimus_010479, partial [Dionaea muscipula]
PVHSVIPRTSLSSGRGRGRSPSDQGGRSPSDQDGSHSSIPSSHHRPSADIDDYLNRADYESLPTADSSCNTLGPRPNPNPPPCMDPGTKLTTI